MRLLGEKIIMVKPGQLSSLSICLFLLLAISETAHGSATLWIRFIRFNNPGGKGDNGHCCDGRLIFCPSKCDHRFVLCLDSRYGRPYDTSSCPYGRKSTGEISNQDSIVFGNWVGGVRNPMLFDFDTWPGEVLMKVGVWDRDDNSDDLVDHLKHSISSRPARTRATARPQRFTIRDRVSLIVEVMLYCQPGSYGRWCNVTCVPRNDATAGYTCGTYTGSKICLRGWTGQNCDQSVDDCLSNPCQHGATCVDGHQGYTCQCPPGYAGLLCDQNINECLSQPCQNNGTCHDIVNGFTCTCDAKWTGVTCHVRDMCREVTCLNGGTCANVNGSFTCTCLQGFAGAVCEVNVDECLSAPCQNGGSCSDLHGAFHCTCSAGWAGVTCDTDIDECASNPCVHARRCHNLLDDFSCVCDEGYTGQKCDRDIDECLTNPCQHGGQCTNQEPGFRCTCPQGFQGDRCQDDVNECLMSPCSEGSTCINVPGNFYCQCQPDFTGPTCDYQIDDCQGQICEHNGTCLDRVRDFECICTERFTGRKCGEYLDRCLATPCQNGATCRDPGYGHSLQCLCLAGWQGQLCEQDVDECLQDSLCANGGRCENLAGSFRCECCEGWTGPLCHQDVNECQQPDVDHPSQPQGCGDNADQCPQPSPSSPCPHNASCLNTLGSYRCLCPPGWHGDSCSEDIDECLTDVASINVTSCQDDGSDCARVAASPSSCSHNSTSCQQEPQLACKNNATCLNTQGSFSCVCLPGWSGRTCEDDVDECLPGNSRAWLHDQEEKHTSRPSQLPGNTNPLGDLTGSVVREKTISLISALETTIPTSPSQEVEVVTRGGDASSTVTAPTVTGLCLHGGVCTNTAGSFQCLCREGWSGPRCEMDVDECGESSPCQNRGQCRNYPGGFSCACTDPWEGRLCSEEKDACLDRPCRHNGTCIRRKGAGDGSGGVQCVCRRGWRGSWCQEDRDECQLLPCLNGGTCLNLIGSFQCQCPEDQASGSCQNGDDEGKEIRLPLYLQGRLGEAEESQITQGIKVFMEEHGDFRHDISIRVFLRTHHMTLGREKFPVTKVTVTVVVENVTLSEEEVADLLNRVPLHKLETYLPMPLFTREVKEYLPSGQSRGQEKAMLVPWYAILAGAVVMAGLALMLMYLIRRKLTVRWWWPRSRADATVIFSQNGSRPSSIDSTTILENQYVITQPDTTTTTTTTPNHHTTPRGLNHHSGCGGGDLAHNSLPATFTAAAAIERPRSQASSRSRSRSGSGARRSEVVWSRPKEVPLRRGSGGAGGAGMENGGRRRESSRAVSLARPATEEGESHCFINSVYMTIPDIPPPRALGVEAGAAGVEVNAGGVEVNAGGVEVNAGGVEVNAGGVEVDAGGMEVNAGGVEVDADGVEVYANHHLYSDPTCRPLPLPPTTTTTTHSD